MEDKKKKDGKIKKFLKGAVAVTLISPLLTSACSYQVMNSDTDSYSDQSQIEYIADEIGCDISVMKFMAKKNDHVKRLRHNEGEPIYISIEDGYNPKYEQMARDSVDYVFSIVGSINDYYKNYEYVSEDEAEELENKGRTVIEYSKDGDFSRSTDRGQLIRKDNSSLKHILENKQVICDPEIQINFNNENVLNDDKAAYNTYVHELLHVFGLGDVYNTQENFETNKFYGNTLMHAGSKIGVITPNDYACLLSAYAKPMEKQELFNYTEKCKQKLKEYTEYYQHALESEVSEILLDNYLENKVDFEGDTNISNFEKEYVYPDGTSIIEKYLVAVNGDEYTFVITDINNNVVDMTKGKATLVNGAYVLNDVELKENIRPIVDSKKYDGYVTNLVIYRTPERDFMYNIADGDLFWGVEHQLQGSSGQQSR